MCAIYEKRESRDEAFAVLKTLSGTDFSYELVDAFIEEIQENGMLKDHDSNHTHNCHK